jgi:L-seryl-tRNA(Ser) seleniumtransferase
VELPSAAIALPARLAAALRQGVVPVVGHVGDGVLLLDLIGVPEESDAAVADAVRAALDQDA